MVRFYGFGEDDFARMSFEMFMEYLDHMPELKRIESGRKLSTRERADRILKDQDDLAERRLLADEFK